MEERSRRNSFRDPSMVCELMDRTRQFLGGMIADCMKRSVDDLLRWILGRVVRTAVTTALFIMAAAFLLLGGSESLIVSGLPRHLAHLVIGAASLLAGLVILKRCDRASGKG
jgi:hypothetical protein